MIELRPPKMLVYAFKERVEALTEEYVVKPTTLTGESGKRVIALDDFTIERLKEWNKIRSEWVMKKKKRHEFMHYPPYV